ncbi:PLP-dependent aminotransferase family protein [Deinococcus actinosclerus]|uniref:aminotransferase-like domain-containing protein n=1 Tax=Deinococcus actinosclerus TaxID=1768108 RepID=UPI000AE1AC39|nr:PLP-dependent aminotransferase family protein [Deinococcus actinosclerus]
MPPQSGPPDAPHWAALLRGWRDHPGPLHTRLHTHLQAAIDRGELTPGQRLPAERTIAALLGVSRATAVTALDDLTASGYLTRHVGRGTHVAPTAPRAQPLLTLRTPVGAAHPSEIDLTIAVPVLTDQQRTRLRDAATHAQYDSPYHPHGLPDLRDLIAQHYARAGLPTTPDQILITSGAQQAIALTAHTLLRRGDTALLETPTYFGAIDVMRAAGAHLTGTPVTAQHLDPDHFAHQTRTHHPRLAFLTPTHHNPTGTTLPHPARQRLAAHLHDTRLPTLEDDTLLDLPFTDTPHPPASAPSPPTPPSSTSAPSASSTGPACASAGSASPPPSPPPSNRPRPSPTSAAANPPSTSPSSCWATSPPSSASAAPPSPPPATTSPSSCAPTCPTGRSPPHPAVSSSGSPSPPPPPAPTPTTPPATACASTPARAWASPPSPTSTSVSPSPCTPTTFPKRSSGSRGLGGSSRAGGVSGWRELGWKVGACGGPPHPPAPIPRGDGGAVAALGRSFSGLLGGALAGTATDGAACLRSRRVRPARCAHDGLVCHDDSEATQPGAGQKVLLILALAKAGF